ncbi:hypothetical protein BS78_K088700 [Paspalum vaginatum]|uniref:Uncharacterized protein n=1 Tax=Paspalum vaginatum TaxID=158149 RepID=A0A9W7XCH2_9POAL|nr:hypothetical protein BS78_K088700 [Paspalum vaginatum]
MMEKRFSSSRPSSLPAVMYALIIVAAIAVSCSAAAAVHGSSEVRDQDTSAAVAYPDGGRQAPGPPAPQAGLTRGPGTPACCA